MALNFEEKFTKPLAADLTQGRVKGAEDFASVIVKYYIDTVTDGMPVGVPPTLPAPGLNPTAPPPFTIGVSGIKVNPASKQAMYEILKAYFMAKDIDTTKMAINGLKDSITQTVNRLNQKKQEIKDIATQIRQASVEIKNVPKYIEEVVEGVKEIIGEEKVKIKNLQQLFANLKEESKSLGVNEDQFKSIFSQELRLIESLQNFEVKSFDDFAKIPQLIRTSKQTIFQLQSQSRFTQTTTEGLTKYDDVKQYALDKIAEVALSFEELSKIVLEPPTFITYVERLAKKNPKAARLYRGLTKLDAVERFVRPQIEKLQVEMDIRKREIQQYIQPKIDLIKQKLEDKVTELSVKADNSMKLRLYSKAKDRVKDFKENHAEHIKQKKLELETIQKAIEKANNLMKKVKLLQEDLVGEFDTIKNELVLLKQDATASVLKYKNLSKEAKKQLADRAAQPLIPTNVDVITPTDPTQPPLASTSNPQEFVKGYERRIDSTADLERTRELRRNALKNQQAPGPTPEQVYDYMNEMGLGDFANTVTKILADSKTDLDTFKQLFQIKRSQFESYRLTIQDLVREIQDLLTMIQELSESKGGTGKTAAWAKGKLNSVGDKVKQSGVGRFATVVGISLMELFMDIVNYLKPYVDKAIAWAKKLFDKVKAFIKNQVDKFNQDIESYLLNLIPLKGHQAQIVKDIQEKKKILDAKRRKVEDIKEKAKYYQKLGTIIGKIARGGAGLSNNLIQKKNFKYPANEPHIKNIVNGIFEYKAEELGPGGAKSLAAEKEQFESKMKMIASIDTMVNGMIVLLQDFQQNAKRGLKADIDGFTLALQQSSSPYAAAWNQLANILNTPVKDKDGLTKAIISLVRSTEAIQEIAHALQSTEIIGFLTSLETKYLGKARQALRSYAETPLGANTKHQALLKEWLDVLDKKQSLVSFFVTKLAEVTDEFFLFLNKQVNAFIDKQKAMIKVQLEKWKANHEVELDRIKERVINTEAVFMSVALDLAARAFWTGATWQGNTGTTHLSLSIGVFKKIKALPQDGVVSMVDEIAQSFELQLKAMTGLVTPPPNTAIPPIPFQGYI